MKNAKVSLDFKNSYVCADLIGDVSAEIGAV